MLSVREQTDQSRELVYMIMDMLTIDDIKQLIASDETRTLELKKTTGELKDGMHSACAFLNTDGGWLIFGIAPKSLKILGENVTDNTRREIAQANDCVMVRFIRNNSDDTKDDPINDTKELTERQKHIVALVSSSDTITIDDMTQKIGASNATVKRELANLQKKGIIVREGGRKNGHWVVVGATNN